MALLGGTGGGGDSHGLGELATLDPQQLQKLFASSGAGGNYGQLPSEAFLKPAAPTTPPLPGAGPADGFQAAAILHQSYDAIEAVGMTAQGTGAGDANIGLSELKRIADVNSGFPPDVRAAAQFMVDHPTSLRASDGPTTGDPNEVHLSKDDLAKLAANAKGHGALTAPPPGVVVAGGNTQDPRGAPSSAQPKLTPDTVVDEKPMDQRRAVETALKNFDTWGQAGGIGERDAFINLQDIEAVSRSPDAPKDQKAAADFLLKNPAFRNPVDTADQGGAVNGEISKRDLQVFLDRNP
jgi:hypothetical protein